mgnify:CR=1 FL=1
MKVVPTALAPASLPENVPRCFRRATAFATAILTLLAPPAFANNLPAPGKTPGIPAPVQHAVSDVSEWQVGEFKVIALAAYDVTARILAAKAYQDGRQGELSPVDLALGWGPMADDAVLGALNISQRDRWYFVSWRDAPITKAQVIENSANTHIMAATPAVSEMLMVLEPDQTVRLRGYLVEARAADGWSWKSSTSRSDTGDGSCELFWVEEVERVPAPQLAENN